MCHSTWYRSTKLTIGYGATRHTLQSVATCNQNFWSEQAQDECKELRESLEEELKHTKALGAEVERLRKHARNQKEMERCVEEANFRLDEMQQLFDAECKKAAKMKDELEVSELASHAFLACVNGNGHCRAVAVDRIIDVLYTLLVAKTVEDAESGGELRVIAALVRSHAPHRWQSSLGMTTFGNSIAARVWRRLTYWLSFRNPFGCRYIMDIIITDLQRACRSHTTRKLSAELTYLSWKWLGAYCLKLWPDFNLRK